MKSKNNFYKYFKGKVKKILLNQYGFQIEFKNHIYNFFSDNKKYNFTIKNIDGDIGELCTNGKVINLSVVYNDLVEDKNTTLNIMINYEVYDQIKFITLEFNNSDIFARCLKTENSKIKHIEEIKLL